MGSCVNMHIRLATLDDIPALNEVVRESVGVLSRKYYSSEQIATALVHVFGVDTQLILDGTYFVAESKGEIAGCGGWSKRETLFGGDQTKSATIDELINPATEAARIRAFYVHPRWARQGVGALILEACENAARSNAFTRVELIATLPGVPFYTATGYWKVEPFEIYLPDAPPLPAFKMVKRLLS